MLLIRIAVAADQSKICSLFEQMLKSIYHTDTVQGYEKGYLDKFWSGGEDRIYVAEDDEIRAFLSVEVYRENDAYLYLDDFSVAEDYRNRGIGTELLKTAERYAEELGISSILLHVEKTNESALRFYERAGYAKHGDDGNRYLLKKTAG